MLHVYDANWSRASSNVNAVLRLLGVGAFHVGVEAYGREYSYGITREKSGVTMVMPCGHPHHTYRESVALGSTELLPDEVGHVVAKLGETWLSKEYHPLRHNCCQFCSELCKALSVKGIPEWVTRLQDAGLAIDSKVGNISMPALPNLGVCQMQREDAKGMSSLQPCGLTTGEYCSLPGHPDGKVVYLRLPVGWNVAYSTEHQRPYYYNREENRSQWEQPEDPEDPQAEVIEIGEL